MHRSQGEPRRGVKTGTEMLVDAEQHLLGPAARGLRPGCCVKEQTRRRRPRDRINSVGGQFPPSALPPIGRPLADLYLHQRFQERERLCQCLCLPFLSQCCFCAGEKLSPRRERRNDHASFSSSAPLTQRVEAPISDAAGKWL